MIIKSSWPDKKVRSSMIIRSCAVMVVFIVILLTFLFYFSKNRKNKSNIINNIFNNTEVVHNNFKDRSNNTQTNTPIIIKQFPQLKEIIQEIKLDRSSMSLSDIRNHDTSLMKKIKYFQKISKKSITECLESKDLTMLSVIVWNRDKYGNPFRGDLVKAELLKKAGNDYKTTQDFKDALEDLTASI